LYILAILSNYLPFSGQAADKIGGYCEEKTGKFCDWYYEMDYHIQRIMWWKKHHGKSDTAGLTGPSTDSSCSETGKLCYIYYNTY